jgi:hypothetical protein
VKERVKERETTEVDPFVREMLLSDPKVVAWLAPDDDDRDDDEPTPAE